MTLLHGLKCAHCNMDWHPPNLCWAYQWLDVETIECIAARIFNEPFDRMILERQVSDWEQEGGR